jgi:hypothetical protein
VTGMLDDLLDANETAWAFADVDCVGFVNNQQVKRLRALATSVCCRSYCGRTADGATSGHTGVRAGAGLARRHIVRERGTPTPRPPAPRFTRRFSIHADLFVPNDTTNGFGDDDGAGNV